MQHNNEESMSNDGDDNMITDDFDREVDNAVLDLHGSSRGGRKRKSVSSESSHELKKRKTTSSESTETKNQKRKNAPSEQVLKKRADLQAIKTSMVSHYMEKMCFPSKVPFTYLPYEQISDIFDDCPAVKGNSSFLLRKDDIIVAYFKQLKKRLETVCETYTVVDEDGNTVVDDKGKTKKKRKTDIVRTIHPQFDWENRGNIYFEAYCYSDNGYSVNLLKFCSLPPREQDLVIDVAHRYLKPVEVAYLRNIMHKDKLTQKAKDLADSLGYEGVGSVHIVFNCDKH